MKDWTEQLPEAARQYRENRRLDEVECIISRPRAPKASSSVT